MTLQCVLLKDRYLSTKSIITFSARLLIMIKNKSSFKYKQKLLYIASIIGFKDYYPCSYSLKTLFSTCVKNQEIKTFRRLYILHTRFLYRKIANKIYQLRIIAFSTLKNHLELLQENICNNTWINFQCHGSPFRFFK